jgi:excisionase family DNA binding protein
MNDYITERELCNWLRISRSTAVRRRKEGMPFVKIGKAVRYDKEKVQQWIEQKSKN